MGESLNYNKMRSRESAEANTEDYPEGNES